MKAGPVCTFPMAAFLLLCGVATASAQDGAAGGRAGSPGLSGSSAGPGRSGDHSGADSRSRTESAPDAAGHVREGTTDPRGTGGSMGGGDGSPAGTAGR
jgi:hypothetical protein